LVSAYEARLVQAGKRVSFERDGVRESGRVSGVARDGALVVRLDDGRDAELYSEHVEVIE
jgi:biotin-(acetyl-CoA carboxylase) ligase